MRKNDAGASKAAMRGGLMGYGYGMVVKTLHRDGSYYPVISHDGGANFTVLTSGFDEREKAVREGMVSLARSAEKKFPVMPVLILCISLLTLATAIRSDFFMALSSATLVGIFAFLSLGNSDDGFARAITDVTVLPETEEEIAAKEACDVSRRSSAYVPG